LLERGNTARVKRRRGRGPFLSVSFPMPLVREVEKIVGELGYWPNKTTFIREAVMEKLEKHWRELEARRGVAEGAGNELS
jgi:Arc/MetJ-type ribon-helix-helix transcriptional regulator